MSLLRFIKENKNTRKIFGKRELKIIEKQLLGINLTQSEKNRLSRDIRQKFEFIKDVSRFSEEFKLKKGNEIKKIINQTKEIILEDILFKKIKKIILFGSATENKLTFRSDIDIAVKLDKISLKEATKFRIRIAGKVPNRVDIQIYNYLPKKIKKEIDIKGKILYKK
ncbi:nucleotidyltransferase domain-containing protein [Candidatus Woesearchaeota archaeon]|nr:nucleotidyltransferase domain-containing protein [Candidatus Woesearchaeota archaeon]